MRLRTQQDPILVRCGIRSLPAIRNRQCARGGHFHLKGYSFLTESNILRASLFVPLLIVPVETMYKSLTVLLIVQWNFRLPTYHLYICPCDFCRVSLRLPHPLILLQTIYNSQKPLEFYRTLLLRPIPTDWIARKTSNRVL